MDGCFAHLDTSQQVAFATFIICTWSDQGGGKQRIHYEFSRFSNSSKYIVVLFHANSGAFGMQPMNDTRKIHQMLLHNLPPTCAIDRQSATSQTPCHPIIRCPRSTRMPTSSAPATHFTIRECHQELLVSNSLAWLHPYSREGTNTPSQGKCTSWI